MKTCCTQIHRFNPQADFAQNYRKGVSLHSHTMHSKEYLGRLPSYIAKFPVGSYIIEREVGRLHLYHGRIIDFRRFYWTPPLSPREAYRLESEQIERKLGLSALVSLSDHDTIEAGMHLRMLAETRNAPISVEWSVPHGQAVFHIGVHNLPPARAAVWMKQFAAFTAEPDSRKLRELLANLSSEPSVLIILNHPFWDADSVGPEQHRNALRQFLSGFQWMLHALELNGMRSRRENREVLRLGEELNLPLISGGDRHGCEPNATLNVTSAADFNGFVAELREERRSTIVLMPQFFEPLRLRLLENAWHALADAPGEFGRRHWVTRVFIEDNGVIKPLSQFAGTRFLRMVEKFRWIMSLAANPLLRPALKLPFLGNEEGGI